MPSLAWLQGIPVADVRLWRSVFSVLGAAVSVADSPLRRGGVALRSAASDIHLFDRLMGARMCRPFPGCRWVIVLVVAFSMSLAACASDSSVGGPGAPATNAGAASLLPDTTT